MTFFLLHAAASCSRDFARFFPPVSPPLFPEGKRIGQRLRLLAQSAEAMQSLSESFW